MNIQEVSERVQMSKQNIRFYEKKGLLHPKRDGDNDYRIYSEADIKQLECIKILRMLDMSIEEIKKIIDQGNLGKEIIKHKQKLQMQIENLQGAIQICDLLQDTNTLAQMDTGELLDTIDRLEKEGNQFKQFINDYKELAYLEAKKRFSFMPENACMNKQEFKEALEIYAKEQHKEIIFLKETMYPEFELDGVKYKAERQFGRYGAVVLCETMEPEKLKAAHISKRNKMLFKLLYYVLPAILLVSLVVGPRLIGDEPFYMKLLFGLGELSVVIAMGGLYYHNQHD